MKKKLFESSEVDWYGHNIADNLNYFKGQLRKLQNKNMIQMILKDIYDQNSE